MSEKLITLFQVESSRIHDIELTPGSTVRNLRTILQEGGYDVVEAEVTVNRKAEGDKVIGRVDNYVLKPGDTVEFKTQKLDLPATCSALKDAAEKQQEKEQQERKCRECARSQCEGCAKPQPKKEGEKVTVAGGRVTIETTENGLIISVR
jgi:hypothetical protein